MSVPIDPRDEPTRGAQILRILAGGPATARCVSGYLGISPRLASAHLSNLYQSARVFRSRPGDSWPYVYRLPGGAL